MNLGTSAVGLEKSEKNTVYYHAYNDVTPATFEISSAWPQELSLDNIVSALSAVKDCPSTRKEAYPLIKTALLKGILSMDFHELTSITPLLSSLKPLFELEEGHAKALAMLMAVYAFPPCPDVGKTLLEHEQTFLCSLEEMRACIEEKKTCPQKTWAEILNTTHAGISAAQLDMLSSIHTIRILQDINIFKERVKQGELDYNFLKEQYAYPVLALDDISQYSPSAFLSYLESVLEFYKNPAKKNENFSEEQKIHLDNMPISHFAHCLTININYLREQREGIQSCSEKLKTVEDKLKSLCSESSSFFAAYIEALKTGKEPVTLDVIKLYVKIKNINLFIWQPITHNFRGQKKSLELAFESLATKKENATLNMLYAEDGKCYMLNAVNISFQLKSFPQVSRQYMPPKNESRLCQNEWHKHCSVFAKGNGSRKGVMFLEASPDGPPLKRIKV